jgi:ketosteroid isomerase-like protein
VIRATERQRLRALLTHDFDTAQKLHADDFELINPLGEVVSREQYIDSGDAFAYSVWKPISPIRVRVHGDAAVIRYESDLEIHGSRGHYWHTDLYEKRNGRWQIVWSQTTGAP